MLNPKQVAAIVEVVQSLCVRVGQYAFVFMYVCMYVCSEVAVLVQSEASTAIHIRIKGQLQIFQRFSSLMVLKPVECCFVALNYYENGKELS
jgi:hypothetical protein